MGVLGNSVTDTLRAMEQNIEKRDWNVMYLWDSRSWYLFTRIAIWCIQMIIGKWVQSTQIHIS